MSHCSPDDDARLPSASRHRGPGAVSVPALATRTRRIALVGTPNAGKTTLFNALAGTRARTGNYPGVTVARREAVIEPEPGIELALEDLPGCYSLDPISPDEQIVVDLLDPDLPHPVMPDALLVVADLTTLRRSLSLISHLLNLGLPTTVVATFGDELARRGGTVNTEHLESALGVPVLAVPAGDQRRLAELRAHLANPDRWRARALPIPLDPAGLGSWIESVLTRSAYQPPRPDDRSRTIDSVLLHPIFGTAIFFAVMFLLFQAVFTAAAPFQDLIEQGFAALGELTSAHVAPPWLASFLGTAIIGGLGGVLVFVPQIALLFLFISVLEGTGYMARAAFLMDRVMSRFGLEGRAFVALLSSLACAIPGIMATRTLPSARDRIATMMAAPLMTCSARIPVYVLLIGLLIPAESRIGPIGAQGAAMFALYLAGALASLGTA
ncbi:MAG: ferrous iron transporter B, partial [bacterium]|nr:ferrous iron transporter B [bacterium]